MLQRKPFTSPLLLVFFATIVAPHGGWHTEKFAKKHTKRAESRPLRHVLAGGVNGRRVTASVVKAIFCVIVVDGLFAMFYAAIDY